MLQRQGVCDCAPTRSYNLAQLDCAGLPNDKDGNVRREVPHRRSAHGGSHKPEPLLLLRAVPAEAEALSIQHVAEARRLRETRIARSAIRATALRSASLVTKRMSTEHRTKSAARRNAAVM